MNNFGPFPALANMPPKGRPNVFYRVLYTISVHNCIAGMFHSLASLENLYTLNAECQMLYMYIQLLPVSSNLQFNE
jgi:hypothetical protein